MPIQIIESRKLPEGENFWLNSLKDGLEAQSLSVILRASEKQGAGAPLDAYIDIILRANPKALTEVYGMEFEVYDKIFKDAGIVPKWVVQGREQGIVQGREEGREQGIAQGRERTARNLLTTSMPLEEIARVTELPIEKVRALAGD